MQPVTDAGRFEQEIVSTQLKIAFIENEISKSDDRVQGLLVKYVDDIKDEILEIKNQQRHNRIAINQMGIDVFTLFRARDAERMMKDLDATLAVRASTLLTADSEKYPTENIWLMDYQAWSEDVCRFWAIIRDWSPSVEDPFAPIDSNYRYPDIIPDNPIFGSHKIRNDYHMLTVVSHRYEVFRQKALDYIGQKASPPG